MGLIPHAVLLAILLGNYMNSGWIKLHRQMFDNKLWLAEPFTKAQAWIDLFANANHEEGSFWVRGNEVVIKRGQIGWSEVTMTRRWRWSRDKVRRFLSYLEHESNIRQQKTPITSIITIVNYDKYQETIQQKDSRQDNRQDTNKNDKKNKNNKEEDKIRVATGVADPPTIISKDEEPMKLEEFVASMRSSPQRYIRLIGEYADEIKPNFTTKSQWKVFTTRNVRPAKQLEPFTDEQIEKALTHIEKNKKSVKNPRGFITEWTLETLLKYITK